MKPIFQFFTIIFILWQTEAVAQIITADPVFPTDQSQVVITFDATQGNAGLAGYTGDVYAHTGVITTASQSGSDWKYVVAAWTTNLPKAKMTRIGTDLYTLTIGPDIRAYYGVPEGETILQMAFVFRSAGPVGGSVLVGKTEQNGDIFYDVYAGGLNVVFVQPDASQLLSEAGETVPLVVASIDADSTALFINGSRVAGTTAGSLSWNFTPSQTGSYAIVAKAFAENETVSDTLDLYVRPAVTIAEVPEGMIDGVNYLSPTSVLISLFAPFKEYVFIIGDFNNWALDQTNYMKKNAEGTRFWIQLDNLSPGAEYAYQFLIDGDLRIADPYTTKILDPWNDSWIPSFNYPDLKPYPTGKTSGIVSVFQTNQTAYDWQVNDFTPPAPDQLIIYELHVRDFVGTKSIKTVMDTLDYLQRLGVNAIELMPVNEFEGNDSWGYNPSFYFATDKAYGTVNDYKAFIDACHSRGMAVIIDMVLNHSFGQSPLVQMYLEANGQVSANSPWYNQSCPHPPYCWGYDFNHQSQHTKDFVDRVNRYWLEEFKVDGFRFDFTKGFTNTQGDGSNYDASRIAILKRMADQIWNVNDKAFVILEHFAPNTEEKELANYGMMIWGNMTHAYNQSTMGYLADSDFSWVSYKKRGWSNAHLVGYMESHDEERQAYKNIKYGNNSNSAHNPRNLNIGVKRSAAAASMFLLVPGPKMIWQFGELAYDYGINHCPDGSYNENCRTSQKPVKWDYQQDWNRRLLYNYYSSLIELRKAHDVFRTDNFTINANAITKNMQLIDDEMSVAVLANFDVTAKNVIPQFSTPGTWYNYYGGDSLIVTDVNATVFLNPGEFRVYTTKRLSAPGFVGLDENGSGPEVGMAVYPNPASFETVITLELIESAFCRIDLVNAFGQVVENVYSGKLHQGSAELRIPGLTEHPSGLYFLRLDTGQRYVTRKLIID